MTTPKQEKQRPVCTTCGSSDVFVDAFAAWYPEGGTWELASVFDDNAVCNQCGQECGTKWETIEPARLWLITRGHWDWQEGYAVPVDFAEVVEGTSDDATARLAYLATDEISPETDNIEKQKDAGRLFWDLGEHWLQAEVITTIKPHETGSA